MPSPEWHPTVADMATLLWARTASPTGAMGAFTEHTRPTATQVQTLIGFAADEVAGAVGPQFPEVLHGQARRCVMLGAAALVERSFFPEQQASNGEDRTAAASYLQMYLDARDRLADAQRSYSAHASAGGGRGLGSMRMRSVVEAEQEDA